MSATPAICPIDDLASRNSGGVVSNGNPWVFAVSVTFVPACTVGRQAVGRHEDRAQTVGIVTT